MALDGNCCELCLGREIYDCASDFVVGNDDDPLRADMLFVCCFFPRKPNAL